MDFGETIIKGKIMVFKILCSLLLVFGGIGMESKIINIGNNNYEKTSGCAAVENVASKFGQASSINVTIKNKTTTLARGDEKFELVLSALENMTAGSRQMPAFGVSLDEETRKAMQDGTWIELVYDDTMEVSGMKFESLLIEVKENYSGINIIRKVNGKYEGRCFYLDLSGGMKVVAATLQDMSLEK